MILRLRFHAVLWGLALLAVSPAYSGTVSFYDSYGNGPGGEFRGVVVQPLAFAPIDLVTNQPGAFETFCVEKNEYIAFGIEYFAGVSTAAIHGGMGGGDPDPLDPLTAYLYERFATGNLTDYTFDLTDGGTARAASADALQHVIWYIEQEEDKSWTDGDNSLADRYYQDAMAHAGSGVGDVRILNLWSDAEMTASPVQDQLILMPEPSVMALAVVALGVLCRSRRGW
jgi:hypothetical protein